ncbi:MAG: GyrI-like domain-containing protein, partial [Coriobacteriales bacterium]|nr:GyrI-like domain-containing protein [Coriobacteriales bacterium]
AIDVPPMNFIMVDGAGSPNGTEFAQALEALYAVAYTTKFTMKKAEEVDYPVMALEALWWADDPTSFVSGSKDDWFWTAMIMHPDVVTAAHIDAAKEAAAAKKDLPALPKLRFEKFAEGLSAQIMYIGAFSDEGPTIQRIHDFIEESGHELRGKHHEIYLSDFRRTAPENLKTVVRQPMG